MSSKYVLSVPKLPARKDNYKEEELIISEILKLFLGQLTKLIYHLVPILSMYIYINCKGVSTFVLTKNATRTFQKLFIKPYRVNTIKAGIPFIIQYIYIS